MAHDGSDYRNHIGMATKQNADLFGHPGVASEKNAELEQRVLDSPHYMTLMQQSAAQQMPQFEKQPRCNTRPFACISRLMT